jgi:hypothetical protein
MVGNVRILEDGTIESDVFELIPPDAGSGLDHITSLNCPCRPAFEVKESMDVLFHRPFNPLDPKNINIGKIIMSFDKTAIR